MSANDRSKRPRRGMQTFIKTETAVSIRSSVTVPRALLDILGVGSVNGNDFLTSALTYIEAAIVLYVIPGERLLSSHRYRRTCSRWADIRGVLGNRSGTRVKDCRVSTAATRGFEARTVTDQTDRVVVHMSATICVSVAAETRTTCVDAEVDILFTCRLAGCYSSH